MAGRKFGGFGWLCSKNKFLDQPNVKFPSIHPNFSPRYTVVHVILMLQTEILIIEVLFNVDKIPTNFLPIPFKLSSQEYAYNY